MSTPHRTKPHLELRFGGGSGLWEQGYAAGFEDGEFVGKKRTHEARFWLGVGTGALLAVFLALVVAYLLGAPLR